MSSLRYGSSFVISSVLYAGLGFSMLNLLDVPEVKEKKTEKVIKVAIITPLPKVVVPPVVAPTPPVIVPPKKVEKPKPKKIIKKVKPKPKKIVKKVKPKPKPKPKKVIKKVVKEPEPVVEEIYEEVYTEPIYIPAPQPVITQRVRPAVASAVATPQVDLSAKKRSFLSKIRHAIRANKKYPKMAKRRGIQGKVHAVFDIQSDGSVSNIRLSGASTILQKAVRKSIVRSFPASIPSKLMGKFPMADVSLNMEFVLE